jgi:fluoride ion exporter CrcB/FEX
MGPVTDNADIPDSRHLWRLHDVSTFSLDGYYLIERGQALASFAYMVASVALSVGALIGALRLVRALS